MSADIAVVHQTDLQSVVAGGVDSFIRDLFSSSAATRFHLFGAVRNGQLEASSLDPRQTIIAGLPPSRRFVPDSFRMAWAMLRHRRALQQFGDVHLHRMDYALPVRWLAPRSRITLFIHTPTAQSLSNVSDSLWRHLPWLNRLLERVALRAADRIVSLSASEAQRLHGYGYKVATLPATFNGSRFFAVPGDREGGALWVGRFEAPKDPELAAQVLSIVAKRGFSATMVGDGSLLKDMCDRYPLIDYRGALSGDEVADLLRRATVLISTSHYEAAPRILVEALGSGTPIVCVVAADPEGLALTSPHSTRVETRSATELAAHTVEVLRRRGTIDHASVAAAVADRCFESSLSTICGD